MAEHALAHASCLSLPPHVSDLGALAAAHKCSESVPKTRQQLLEAATATQLSQFLSRPRRPAPLIPSSPRSDRSCGHRMSQAASTPWSVLESLLLAQAVFNHGDDSWQQISRAMRAHPAISHPQDFFTAKVRAQLAFSS
ncbi:hypothetical protein BDK51DRAFT_39216 [Blyttiomyces helicus]|uniref:Myb-like domain-containing protein n=1 Tax=Blyttiomyces helicus TaxID=388810 RepID=A0A4P9W269_9FUNG|nr:hypothetical protein BDK51DRAFT_39216 [Blyttiomyces helicus]|eukprot:RKO85822.1 hypothetical protein BDK51DRAFT_39216 [Blyttiomyces helicus]